MEGAHNNELEGFDIEILSDGEAISAAYNAYAMASEIDGALLSKEDQRRLSRIKRNALFVVDEAMKCIKELYSSEEDAE